MTPSEPSHQGSSTPSGPPSLRRSTAGPSSLAVLTSGGDAPGMNAAVRAVVRTAVHHQVPIHAIHEGFQGLIEGGDRIEPFSSRDVGGILQRGGTIIGTARSDAFRTVEGRRQAAQNLVERGIDALVVIGGDGSLTGAHIFRQEWPQLLADLVDSGRIEQAAADACPMLYLVGMVGSIDNDMFGTDMTIGADTALHRIIEAMDALHSTAASHQRSFIVEVMGRHCGYLALMSALAAGVNWTFIPERPADADTWERDMADALRAGRQEGRRQNIVVVAEGAQDTRGRSITAERVQQVLQTELGEDTRITILGHVQRGGSPSAFDRNLGTLCGFDAVELLLRSGSEDEPQLVGLRENRIVSTPLMDNVDQTRKVAALIAAGDYEGAMRLRGGSFTESWNTFHTLVRARPRTPQQATRQRRIAILHAGGPSPGMNTAVRAAVRLGIDAGNTMFGVTRGFEGLAAGNLAELTWMDVTSWTGRGGAELATSRAVPSTAKLEAMERHLREQQIDGLLMIGGWAGYQTAHALHVRRERSGLRLPIVCLPASINNDLPGSELAVGADTALNNIIGNVDKIKESAVSTHRCFVVETMGGDCGYLALMSGMASGAERLYLPEEGIALADLASDVDWLRSGFEAGKRLGLVIRGEGADRLYTTAFIHSLFERESHDLFDVRESILGHLQQGGAPSPFDRIQATRLATRCIDHLIEHADDGASGSAMVGHQGGSTRFTDLGELPGLCEDGADRPKEQPWMSLRPIARVMARPTAR